MSDIAFAPATRLAAALRARELGCRELLEHYLARLQAFNPAVNAVVVTDLDRARARADAADAALARGEAVGPLHGVPLTVKESFQVAGLPTTWGVPAQRGNVAASTALAVQRLEAAGAVLFGKTNVPLMLADWQSFNAVYGTTANPWDLGRTPGGSSGGSAAALAAGLTGLELGSDIGGSLRIPAHYCGIHSHKPTWGIVPPTGHGLAAQAPPTDVSVVGPMARSAADLRLALEVIAGPEPERARAWRLALPPSPHARLRDYRVALMLDSELAEVDEPVRTALRRLGEFLEAQGAVVGWNAQPALDFTAVARDATTLIRCTQSAGMAAVDYEWHRELCAGLDPDDDSYAARLSRAITVSHRDWLQAHARRHAAQQVWERFFGQWDLLLCPVASSVAFAHDQTPSRHLRTVRINGRERPSIEQMFWPAMTGMAWLPATAAPIGRSPEGLPIGVQIVGPQYADLDCIRFAELLEADGWRFTAPPAFDVPARNDAR